MSHTKCNTLATKQAAHATREGTQYAVPLVLNTLYDSIVRYLCLRSYWFHNTAAVDTGTSATDLCCRFLCSTGTMCLSVHKKIILLLLHVINHSRYITPTAQGLLLLLYHVINHAITPAGLPHPELSRSNQQLLVESSAICVLLVKRGYIAAVCTLFPHNYLLHRVASVKSTIDYRLFVNLVLYSVF